MPPAICRVGKTWINLKQIMYAREAVAGEVNPGETGITVFFATGFEKTFVESADEIRKALDACHETNQPQALRLQKTMVTPPPGSASASSPHVLPRFENAHEKIVDVALKGGK